MAPKRNVKQTKGVYWALVDRHSGRFVSDRSGVLTWSRRRDVPWSDEERVARVRVTVLELENQREAR